MPCTCNHALADHAAGRCAHTQTRFDASVGDVVTRCPCKRYADADTVPVDAAVLAGAEVQAGTGVEAPETASRNAGGQLYARVGTDVQYLAEESPGGKITVTAVGTDVRETVTAKVWRTEFTPV